MLAHCCVATALALMPLRSAVRRPSDAGARSDPAPAEPEPDQGEVTAQRGDTSAGAADPAPAAPADEQPAEDPPPPAAGGDVTAPGTEGDEHASGAAAEGAAEEAAESALREPVPDPVVATPAQADRELAVPVEEPTAPAPAADAYDDYQPLRDSPEAVAARRRVVGGGILIGTGTVLGLGALGLGVSDPCTRRAGNSCNVGARNRAALSMGIPAIGVVAAGIVFVVLARRSQRRLAVELAWHHGRPRGASLRGRF